VLLGDGDDTLTFDLTNQGGPIATLIAGEVDGGAGANTLNVVGNTTVTNLVTTDATNADRVLNVQTLNLTSTQSVDEELQQAVDAIRAGVVVTNDGDDDDGLGATDDVAGELSNAQTADYTNVDIAEFTGLTTINLSHEAAVINATPEEAVAANRFEGDAAVYGLLNLTGTEAITLASVETLDTNNNSDRAALAAATTDDTTADVTGQHDPCHCRRCGHHPERGDRWYGWRCHAER